MRGEIATVLLLLVYLKKTANIKTMQFFQLSLQNFVHYIPRSHTHTHSHTNEHYFRYRRAIKEQGFSTLTEIVDYFVCIQVEI